MFWGCFGGKWGWFRVIRWTLHKGGNRTDAQRNFHSMEKSKKLKLKRKIQQKQTYEAVNSKQEQNTFISADRDDAVAECVTLTSDSDNDPVAVSDKERKLVDKNTIQELNPNKTRYFILLVNRQ